MKKAPVFLHSGFSELGDPIVSNSNTGDTQQDEELVKGICILKREMSHDIETFVW